MPSPQFILCESTAAASDALVAYASRVRDVVAAHGGSIVVASAAEDSLPLEEGTEKHALVALKFPSADAAAAFWSDPDHPPLLADLEAADGFLHAISIEGIPEEGLPGEPLPTTATVTIPDNPAPSAFMLVQGTIRDRGPIEKYMEIIVPMIIERGGVYRAWSGPEGPQPLAGKWSPQSLVFSEYPSVEVARDFWYSDTYQNVAIPTRAPVSTFTVLLFEAAPWQR